MKQFGNSSGQQRISYLKFSEVVEPGRERLRTYYYDCGPFVSNPPTKEEIERQKSFDRFKTALEREPRFQVRLGRLVKYPGPNGPIFEQKKVDVLLAVDLL